MTQVKKERYGAVHQFNWKKIGLSRAFFQAHRVEERGMPTDRCKAAFRFLMHNNRFYKMFQELQGRRMDTQASMNISSYDLFIVYTGTADPLGTF